MQRSCFIILFLAVFFVAKMAANTQPVLFTENKGQVRDQFQKQRNDVLFSGRCGASVFHLRNNGISYQQYKLNWTRWEKRSRRDSSRINNVSIYRVDIIWLNSNISPIIEKLNPSRDYDNYYLEGCPEPVTHVRRYTDVVYKNIYSGIDVHYYDATQLKYDFLVHPGANPAKIIMEVKGAKKISVDGNGNLVIKTPYGEIIEDAPLVLQGNKKIQASWKCAGNKVSFVIGKYDTSEELTIDPGVRIWATYYGDTGIDQGLACATDSQGNVYMAGNTDCVNSSVIATSGAQQVTYGGNYEDAFLVKFSPGGVRRWGTYYGTNAPDEGRTCAADQSGNIFMAGYTTSAPTNTAGNARKLPA